MALSNITFIRGEGGLGRPLAGEDYISGIVAYFSNANLPSGFTTTDRVKEVFSISEAESLGIAEGSAVHGVLWYHIDQYFKIQPQGRLFIGLYDNTSIDYTVIELVQAFASGKIRQIAVFDPDTAFAGATVTTLQASADTLEAADQPLSILYAADFTGTTLAALPDLRALANKNVSVILGEDGAGAGAALAVSSSASVTSIGATLGAVSLANVHENIGWVSKFNLVNDSEFDVPAFGTGDLLSNITISEQSTLATKGYIFLVKYTGFDGSYHNDSATAIAETSDYAFIENNRTIDKAIRGVRTFLLPSLNSPITVNSDGQLEEDFIAVLKNDASRALEAMLINEEVSAYEVVINPLQDVLSTSKVVIGINIVPRGVARQIEVNIGFKVSL